MLALPESLPFAYYARLSPALRPKRTCLTVPDGLFSVSTDGTFMRRFNVTVLFSLVVGSGLLVGVLFLVHWLQTGRIARALRAWADRAAAGGDEAETARFL